LYLVCLINSKSADTIAQELAGESADLAKAAKEQLNESKKDE
jgi:hypothetical protein